MGAGSGDWTTEYEQEGLTVARCFPSSFKRAPLLEQMDDQPSDAEMMAWENFNIAIEVQDPFALLMFTNEADYNLACQTDPAIELLTAVKLPDDSVAVWFKWGRWWDGFNSYLKDFNARLICRNYLAPAPPSQVGERHCEFINKASPLLQPYDPDITDAQPQQVRHIALQAIPLAGLMAFAPPAAPSYMSGGLMDTQGKMIIAGEPKAGKSRLVLNLALSLSTGLPFLGFQTMGYPRILFVQFEVSESRMRERVLGVARAWKIPVDNSMPIFFLTIPGLQLDNKHGIHELRKLIRAFRAEVVILDPLSKIHTRDEKEQGEMLGLLNTFDDLIDELDISVVLVHHMKKPSGQANETWSRIRGSSQIPAWADTMLLLEQPTHEAKPLVRGILRNGEDFTKAIRFNNDHTIEVIGDIMNAIEADIQEACFRHPGDNRKSIATRVAKNYNIDITEIYSIMKGMERKGVRLPQ
jgi:hypothetical protein